NGGAVAPEIIRQRVQGLVQAWFAPRAGADWQPSELENPYPHLAVAIGAAYYGLVRMGEGVRVGSGSPRAYYVGVAGGEPTPTENDYTEANGYTAVCLVPRGTEEGFQTQLKQSAFQALPNQPVAFQIYASST